MERNVIFECFLVEELGLPEDIAVRVARVYNASGPDVAAYMIEAYWENTPCDVQRSDSR